ncbi:MAG: PAS domain S-box protein, partial [Bacteroidetes bacterium]|nr:PAS domain S-box protein [Bacteroidota bacterium]
IIVSGTIGEDTAVEAMRAGAHDYIIKGKLQRLVPAIERELRETQIRSERKQAEESLRESEERYRLLFESNPLPMFVYNIETLRFVGVNDAAVEHYGYARDEFLAMTIKDIRSPEELPRLEANLSGPSQPQERSGPWKHRKKDGTLIDVEIISHEIMFLNRPARLVLANDITELKRAEEERRKSEERFKKAIEDIFKFVPEAVLVFTRSLNVYKHNKAFEDTVQKYAQKLNYAEEELADLIIKQVAERLAESNGTEIRIPRKEG